MSSDIEILHTDSLDVDVTVRSGSLSITLWDCDEYKAIRFDLSDKGHREALEKLVSVIQHQLDVHREGNVLHEKE